MYTLIQSGKTNVKYILIIIAIAFIVGGGILAYQYWWLPKEGANNIACTMEAKLCPDGSAVGRTGPNCEFAKCPDVKKDETAGSKMYTDSSLNYSFKYPPATCELQRLAGDTTFAVCYLPKGSDGGPKNNNGYVISLGFISKSQLSVMGISYCGAHLDDSSRCESFKIGIVTASIDWGTGNDASASVWISHPDGGIVAFALQPVTAESKEILKQILSTFKFLDENQESVISKTCVRDSDCVLNACTGCFNKEWIQTAPADLPCMNYSTYSCRCIIGKCSEVK